MVLSKESINRMIKKFKDDIKNNKPNKACISCRKLLYKNDVKVLNINNLDICAQNKIEVIKSKFFTITIKNSYKKH